MKDSSLEHSASIQPETGAMRDRQVLFLSFLNYVIPWGLLLNFRKRSDWDTPASQTQIFLWSVWLNC